MFTRTQFIKCENKEMGHYIICKDQFKEYYLSIKKAQNTVKAAIWLNSKTLCSAKGAIHIVQGAIHIVRFHLYEMSQKTRQLIRGRNYISCCLKLGLAMGNY